MKDEEVRKKLEKHKQDFEKWENSIEGVMYNLNVLGDAIMQDEGDKLLVAKTLLKLPQKIREKVLDEVIFIMMRASGTVAKARFTKIIKKEDMKKIGSNIIIPIEQDLIILNFSVMKKGREMDTIAHEVAHFILGHPTIHNNPKAERKADDLTEKWGFRRGYKNYDFFEEKNPFPKNYAKIKQEIK